MIIVVTLSLMRQNLNQEGEVHIPVVCFSPDVDMRKSYSWNRKDWPCQNSIESMMELDSTVDSQVLSNLKLI